MSQQGVEAAAHWYALGEAALAQDRLEEAEQALWHCLADVPRHAAALHLLGRIRARQGDPATALALQQQSEACDPALGWNAFAAADLLLERQQWREAAEAFRRAERALGDQAWITARRQEAEGLHALGGERLGDGLGARAYQAWCRSLEPPLGAARPAGERLEVGWWVDLAADAQLRPGALAWLQEHLREATDPGGERPAFDLLYPDEDRWDPLQGRHDPWFKPGWVEESFWATPWLEGCALWRRAWLQDQHLPPAPPASKPVERWRWQLAALARGPRVGHLPRILVHRRRETSTPGVMDPAAAPRAEALHRHLQERGEAVVEVRPESEGFGLLWATPSQCCLTIVVATRDRPDLLGRCLSSVEASLGAERRGLDLRWLVLNNGSRQQATADLLQAWRHRAGSQLEALELDQPFNWSLLNNRGALQARGDLLLFLNNDVHAGLQTRASWLRAMAGQALRPSVGAVGACLLQDDGRLQHAGLLPAMAPGCEHPYRGLPWHHGVHRGRSRCLTAWPAVTGACLMVRRELFLAAGGFDPALPIEGNDVDLCLRLGRWNRRQLVVPQAVLRHEEGASRGRAAGASRSWQEAMALLQRRWPRAMREGRPWWPAACSLATVDGRPLELAGRGWL